MLFFSLLLFDYGFVKICCDLVPAHGVMDVMTDVVNATAINVSWILPPPRFWNGLITNYSVTYHSQDPLISVAGIEYLSGNFNNDRNPRNVTCECDAFQT